MSVRGILRAVAACAAVCSVSGRATAQVDIEPNNSLAEIQVVGVVDNTTIINGSMEFSSPDPAEYVDVVYDTLTPGSTNFHDFYELPPAASVMAFIDNTIGVGEPDTMLRSFDENGEENAFNDDGSLIGGEYASGLLTYVLDDGSLHIELTGFPDGDFVGDHEESGDYALFVKLGPFGDTDFFQFSGLLPGAQWEVETGVYLGSAIDTIVTWYSPDGEILDQNDDIDYPDNLFSHLSGEAPANGSVILAVTGYPDFTNVGSHLDGGLYEFTFTATDLGSVVAGDTDEDGDVDLDDLNNVRNFFGTPQDDGDADHDGDTDLDDLNAVRNNFGNGAPQPVPEPAGIALAGLLLAPLGLLKRTRFRVLEARPFRVSAIPR